MGKTPKDQPQTDKGTLDAANQKIILARQKLEAAERMRQRKDLARAQKLCEQILKEHPDYVAALHTPGLVLADRARHSDALPHLVRAEMLNPDDWTTLTALSGVYLIAETAQDIVPTVLSRAERVAAVS
jgi:Flp pilus assembly protein TadD